MKFFEQKIPGVWLIEPEPFVDHRGMFHREFCQREFHEKGIDNRISQTNISQNHAVYTLRGFHYQVKPHEESKTLSCISGSIFDIIVDLRPTSQTFLQWIALTLDTADGKSLHVPAGCANAYLTLEKNTSIHYFMSDFYTPGFDRGFRYNDPFFKFTWIAQPLVISDKDQSYPDFDPYNISVI